MKIIFWVLALALLPVGLGAQTPQDSLRAEVIGAQEHLDRLLDLSNDISARVETVVQVDTVVRVDTLQVETVRYDTVRVVDTVVRVDTVLVPQIVIQVDTVFVERPVEPPPLVWHRVLADTTVLGDVFVPAGERWLIGPNVEVAGHVRTDSGTVAMRPGSSLKFLGGDPSLYVGGGLRYDERFVNDLGIWIGGTGVLDIQGTPKTAWSRDGWHSSWPETDEVWMAPYAASTPTVDRSGDTVLIHDLTPVRWYPSGDSVPQAHALVPPTEVINVTRDIVIEGPGHIHISSNQPQILQYFTLRNMGVARPNQGQAGMTSGRYAIHFHMMGEGSRGTVVRGVASIEARGRVFVPHGSHGISFIDDAAVNSWGEAFWWDTGRSELGMHDRSNDISVQGLVVSGVNFPRSFSGATSYVDGVQLNGGDNLTMRNSAVSGVRGGVGFNWPSAADNHGSAHWTFDKGNVAHNNSEAGLRFWNNNSNPHVTRDVITYRNVGAGVENGAYSNANFFEDITMIEDGLYAQANGRFRIVGADSIPQTFRNISGDRLTIGHIRLPPGAWQQYTNCEFESGYVGFDNNQRQEWAAVFQDCNIDGPEDIRWPNPMLPALEGSWVLFRANGVNTARVDVIGGVPVPTSLLP